VRDRRTSLRVGGPEAQVFDLDSGGIQVADDSSDKPRAALDSRAHVPPIGVRVHAAVTALRAAFEHPGCGVQVTTFRYGHLQVLAAAAGFQPAGGTLGDHTSRDDDGDTVRQPVGLVEVLGGQKERGSAGEELSDNVPHREAAPRVEAGG
jgi:hypothetical protein